MISTKARAVRAPTPGWVIRRFACGHFPLPVRQPGSTLRSPDSIDPTTPAARFVAGWPTAPTGRTPVSAAHLAATTASYSAGLHSTQPPAVDSSPASAPAPCGGGATAIAADLGFPNWAPKSAENHPSAAV